MGLCEVLVTLTDAVAKTCSKRDPQFELLAHILRAAPVYRDACRLDAWDSAYRHASADGPVSPEVELLDLIYYELGSFNLYGAFDVAGTAEEYRRVVRELEARGVRVSPAADVTDW